MLLADSALCDSMLIHYFFIFVLLKIRNVLIAVLTRAIEYNCFLSKMQIQGGTSELVLCVCLFWCQFLYCIHRASMCLDDI